VFMQVWLNRIQNDSRRWCRDESPRLVSGILAAAIVVEAARIILPLLPSPAYAAVPASRPPPHRNSGVDAQAIVERHLFGVALDDSAADSGDPSPTTANLILQGTIAASDPRHGVAIISAEGPAQVYQVGDGIGGATLNSVYLDRVMLKRDGRLESLALPRLPASGGDRPRPGPDAKADDAPGPGRATPKSMGDLMGTDPATNEDSGAFEGFRLRPGRTGAAFMRAGLRNGDIMTAVNGTPLANQNQQTSQEIVNTMLTTDRAIVSVLRNGKPVEVSVDLGR
jgi:general secretion pathway protein C